MNYIKYERVSPGAIISAGGYSKQNLQSVIYSYDKNVSKLIIPVVVPNDRDINFKDIVTVKVLLTFEQDGVTKKIEDFGEVEGIKKKTLSYIITDKLKGYQGQVNMNIYLELANDQQIDLAEYSFTMTRSKIDEDLPEIQDFYFKSLDDVIVEMQLKADATLSELAESLKETKAAAETAAAKADDVQQQIQANNIVTVTEHNKVQLKKVTADDGTAALNVADSETMLDRILGAGAGLKTGLASAKVVDSPSTTSATRFSSNMIASTGGSVIAQSADGKVWSRIISGSKWHTPWEQMIPRTEFDALVQRVAALENKTQ